MAFATAQDPTMDGIEADEMAAAAAHAGIPVEPKSPASQVTPPGLDTAQLLADFAKMKEKMDAMQTELNKVNTENIKLKSVFSAGDQPEQPPEQTQTMYPPEFFMTPQKETAAGPGIAMPAPWNQDWDPWWARPDPWKQADGGWQKQPWFQTPQPASSGEGQEQNWCRPASTTTYQPWCQPASATSWPWATTPQAPQYREWPQTPQAPQYQEWLQNDRDSWYQQGWSSSWCDLKPPDRKDLKGPDI